MFTKMIIKFYVATEADQRADADPRVGSWSEGVWRGEELTSDSHWIPELLTPRAALLPKQASIIGFALARYDVLGNRLIPLGTSTAKRRFPGASSQDTDAPQMALQLSGTSEGKANSNRFALKCLPDGMVVKGEYTPTPSYKTKVRAYCDKLANAGWGFVGRAIDADAKPVRGILNGKVNCLDILGVVVGQSYLRLVNVKDANGNSVSGSYLVTAVAGPEYTLQGLPTNIVAGNSGMVRLDGISFCNYDTVEPDCSVVRKIGRPSKGYRGKASKR